MRPCIWIIALPLLMTPASSADRDSDVLKSTLDRLLKNSGVYNVSKTGKAPSFVVDPGWPQTLPNHWILGQLGAA